MGAALPSHRRLPGRAHAQSHVWIPRHAAFSEMRARGANSTDIAVWSWPEPNDGVMPQPSRPQSRARAAGSNRRALNKVDLPDKDEQRVSPI